MALRLDYASTTAEVMLWGVSLSRPREIMEVVSTGRANKTYGVDTSHGERFFFPLPLPQVYGKEGSEEGRSRVDLALLGVWPTGVRINLR